MRRRIFFTALVAAGVAMVYACANASSAGSGSASSPADGELQLPTVPEELTRQSDRADYVLTRFWDALDFTAPAARDTAFMERNFADFLRLMPQASSDSVRSVAVDNLLTRASADSLALDLAGWLAETSLNSTDAPTYSEGTYIMFLRRLATSERVDEAMRERYMAQLRDMDCNRPGSVAADFPYTAVDGSKSTLHELTAAHDSTLIVFYDPDCHDCHVLIDSLSRDTSVSAALASGSMAIMALYPYDDTDLWRRTASELPSGWIVATNPSVIEEEGMYYLPRTPRTYLLDRSARILRLRE